MELPNLNRKQVLIIGAGSLVLLLLYRWYASRSTGQPAAAGDPAMSGTNPGYSDLAGQLQSAGAALQNQETTDVQGLAATEAADIADLNAQLGALTGAYSGLGSQLGTLQSHVDDLGAPVDVSGITQQVNDLASGVTRANRTATRAAEAAKAAAWNAGGHSISYAQHTKNLAARKSAGAPKHQQTTHSAVAPSSHHPKPGVKARPHTTPHPSGSHHVTPKAGTKPTNKTAAPSTPHTPKPKPGHPAPHPAHRGRR